MSVIVLLADVAKSAYALLLVSMGDNALNAKRAVLLFVYMGENALDVKSAEAHLFSEHVIVRRQCKECGVTHICKHEDGALNSKCN